MNDEQLRPGLDTGDMTTTDLPAIVTDYFERMTATDKAPVVDVFSPDATVRDDGHTYRGRDEILAWLTGAASAYTTTSTRLSTRRDGATTVIRILLEGDFPGGRVELTYVFEVGADGTIDALSITA